MQEQMVTVLIQEQIQQLQQQGLTAVAVLMGHEDWLEFSNQSEVSCTPFGSARLHQSALNNLQLIRVDETRYLQVVTAEQLAEYQCQCADHKDDVS